MSELTRYPSYKDSGVPWLGEIPSHWHVKRLKFAISNISQKVDAQSSSLRYFGLENIESFTGKLLNKIELTSEGVAHQFEKNDVLFGKLRPYLAKVYLAKTEGLSSTEALIFRPSSEIAPKFLFYYCLSQDFINEVNGTTFGSKMPRANWDNISSLPTVFPSLDEQVLITNFLDIQLIKIDSIINKQNILLSKLIEQRYTIITSAVTRGLDSNVSLKDSNLQGMGDIPSHWETKKIKYLIDNISTGSTPSTSNLKYYESKDIDWYGPSDFTDNEIILSKSKKKVSLLAINEGVVKLIPENSVLVIGIGATLGKVALTNIQCTSNQQINSLIINEFNDPKFIAYSLQVKRDIMRLMSSSSTLGILNQEKSKSLILAVPSLEEQRLIVSYLEKEVRKIDEMSYKTRKIIDSLKEYRSTLITQAITGKIDVREFKSNQKGAA